MSEARNSRKPARLGAGGFAPGTLLSELPATARRILDAAWRILEREGFAGLTYEAISAESGEYKDSVRYHFGGKDGLIAAVIDSSVHDTSIGIYAAALGEPDLRRRLTAVIDASRALPKSDEARVTWELLPHIVRDPELRPRLAELYEWYRGHYLEIIAGDGDPERRRAAREYACIALAVIDGLALQKALDPEGVDLDAVFDRWLEVVSASIGAVLHAGPDAEAGH
jgi:AcrR family transcriptional regulator